MSLLKEINIQCTTTVQTVDMITVCCKILTHNHLKWQCFVVGQVDCNAISNSHTDQKNGQCMTSIAICGVMVSDSQRVKWANQERCGKCLHELMWPWKSSQLFSCTGHSSWADQDLKVKAPQSFKTMTANRPKLWHHNSEDLNPSGDSFQYRGTSTASIR